MNIGCDLEYITLENEYGCEIPSVRVTCQRCDHATESYGDALPSVRRCLVLMREQCPEHEKNFYVTEVDDVP